MVREIISKLANIRPAEILELAEQLKMDGYDLLVMCAQADRAVRTSLTATYNVVCAENPNVSAKLKIQAIKIIREETNAGLKESKEFSDGLTAFDKLVSDTHVSQKELDNWNELLKDTGYMLVDRVGVLR